MTFEILKVIHILSVSLMVGATAINGLLHASAISQARPSATAITLRNIMLVSRLIMAPGFAGIVITGTGMILVAGFDPLDTWLLTSIAITALLIAAFGIGYILESQLEKIANDADTENLAALPPTYRHAFRKAAPIGAFAAVASILVIYLMVAKPL